MSLDDDGFLVKVYGKILEITVFWERIEYAWICVKHYVPKEAKVLNIPENKVQSKHKLL